MLIRTLTRRAFTFVGAGALAMVAQRSIGQTPNAPQASDPPAGLQKAPFERDYDAPSFKPSWKEAADQPANGTGLRHLCPLGSRQSQDSARARAWPAELNHRLGRRRLGNGVGGASHMDAATSWNTSYRKAHGLIIFCAAMHGQRKLSSTLNAPANAHRC